MEMIFSLVRFSFLYTFASVMGDFKQIYDDLMSRLSRVFTFVIVLLAFAVVCILLIDIFT